VPIHTDPTFSAGPTKLFAANNATEDQRFSVVSVVVVLNWSEELNEHADE
jgi:hypothetical protein